MTPHIIIDKGKEKTIAAEFKKSEFSIIRNDKGTFNFFVKLESNYFRNYSAEKINALETQYQCVLDTDDAYLNAHLQIYNRKSVDEIFDNQLYTKTGNVIVSYLYKDWHIETYNNYFYFERGENESEIILYWVGFERDIYEDSYTNPIEVVAVLDIVRYDSEAAYSNTLTGTKIDDKTIDFSLKSKPSEQRLLHLKELTPIVDKIKNNTKISSEIFKKGSSATDVIAWKKHIAFFIDQINTVLHGVKSDENDPFSWQNNPNLAHFSLLDLAQLWESTTNLAISVLQTNPNRREISKKYVALLDDKLAETLLPFKMIKQCKEDNLTYLDLYDCGLLMLPYQLFELHHLETLILGHYYTCYNDLEGFRNTYSRNLKISNKIAFLPKQIGQLKNLKRLVFGTQNVVFDQNFRKNPIENLILLSNIESLTVHSEKIESLHPLSNLNKLTFLDISECPISEFAFGGIAHLKQLEDIEVNHTKITTYKWVEQFPQLKRFYGAYYLKDFTDFESAQSFKKLANLHTLIANFNDLDIIADLQNLRVVYIEAQDILNFHLIHKLKNLERLGTNSKEITDFSFLESFKNLEVLDLDDTDIVDLEPISGLKKLKVLQIGDTKVKTLHPITGYENLERIKFADTEIDNLEPLKNCSKLRIVYGNNHITDLMPISEAIKNSLSLPNIRVRDDLYVEVKRDNLNDESKAFLDYLAQFRQLGWD